MRIVCLGDSCTYGQNVRADQAWPAVLARLTGHDVRNAGACGDTTRLGLERWKYHVSIHEPDFVVLQFGHNDANEWDGAARVSIDSYIANLFEMCDRVSRLGADVIVITPHAVPGHPDKQYRFRVGLYAKAAEDALPVVAPWLRTKESILDDGYHVHPDEAMHERYAEQIVSCL